MVKSLAEISKVKPGRDAYNAAWLWLRKVEKDTGTELHPIAFLQQKEILASIIEVEAIRPAIRRDRKARTMR